jgi:hypothetical protein
MKSRNEIMDLVERMEKSKLDDAAYSVKLQELSLEILLDLRDILIGANIQEKDIISETSADLDFRDYLLGRK